MISETNRQLVNQFYQEVINRGNVSAVEAIFSPEFTDHTSSGDQNGIPVLKQFLKMVSTAFPDIHLTMEELFGEKDRIAVRLAITGTQTGVLMGTIPPSGKQAHWTGIDIFRIENGKIVERWSQRDLLGLMQQIGVIPTR